MRPEWFPDWTGHSAVVVASGESAGLEDLEQAKGKAKVLAINNSWNLVPWADAMYAGDRAWWRHYEETLDFPGLWICSSANHSRKAKAIRLDITIRTFIFEPLGHIGYGLNSGFHGINLAIQFGAKRIALVGFDFGGDHWHGPHKDGLTNPGPGKLERWRRFMAAAAPELATRGIEVVNCSPISRLTCFPKGTLTDFLDGPASQSSLVA